MKNMHAKCIAPRLVFSNNITLTTVIFGPQARRKIIGFYLTANPFPGNIWQQN